LRNELVISNEFNFRFTVYFKAQSFLNILRITLDFKDVDVSGVELDVPLAEVVRRDVALEAGVLALLNCKLSLLLLVQDLGCVPDHRFIQ